MMGDNDQLKETLMVTVLPRQKISLYLLYSKLVSKMKSSKC